MHLAYYAESGDGNNNLKGFHKPMGDVMEPVSSYKFTMGKIGILKKPDALKTIK